MTGMFKFELVTPERMLLSEDAAQVVVPGVDGDFAVLAGHAPVVSALRPGVVNATLGDSASKRILVKGGFAEIDGERLIVLAEHAVDLATLDATGIAAELQAAEAQFAAATTDAARYAAASTVDQLRALQR
jgi:F-type H+-transporting ATPase subunit epsilon